MSPRLKDIAEELGLSVTTVSRALAGYGDVSDSTRRRVLEVARSMGYVPDATARRLQKQQTNAIGFIIPILDPRFSDPFFSELLAGLGGEAARHGYDLVVSTTTPGMDEIELYRQTVLSRRVDGMLVVRTRRQDARIAFLLEQNTPFVAFGHTEQGHHFPWVSVDGTHGTQLAVHHLVSEGHRKIGYIAAPSELMHSVARRRGFWQGISAHSLAVHDEWLLEGDLTQRSGRMLAALLLQNPDRPTALIADNDLMALGAMAAVQERGLRVGRDLSIVGFDDIPPAGEAHPPLTTVRQPIQQIATLMISMLVQILKGEELKEPHVLLTPELVVRESTGPPPQQLSGQLG